jgi:hypothetical protein
MALPGAAFMLGICHWSEERITAGWTMKIMTKKNWEKETREKRKTAHRRRARGAAKVSMQI